MQRPNQGLSLKQKNLINDWQNVIAYKEEPERSEALSKNVVCFKISWRVLW